MKNLLWIIGFLFFVSCQLKTGSEKQDNENIKPAKTQFEFQEEMHNFGAMQAGEIVIYTFVFTNTGDNNLQIENIESDCGCVIVNTPEKLVKPGDKGVIEIEFNSAGLWGRQLKTITIQANTEKPKQLVIFADVDNEQLNIKN